jgi:hypothetical protein
VLQGAYWYAGDSGVPIGFKSITEFLTKKPPTPQEVDRLLAFFKAARANPEKIDREALKAVLQRTPELASLADTIPQTRVELYAFVQSLFVMLSAFAGATIWVTNAMRRSRIKRARAERDAEALRKREARERRQDAKKRRERLAQRARLQLRQERADATNPRKLWKPKRP